MNYKGTHSCPQNEGRYIYGQSFPDRQSDDRLAIENMKSVLSRRTLSKNLTFLFLKKCFKGQGRN